MARLKLFLFFIIGMLFVSFSYGAGDECVSFYGNKAVTSHIRDRYQEFANKNPNSLPMLVMDDFLKGELSAVYAQYDSQVARMARVGTESNLQSRMNVFEAVLDAAGMAISAVEKNIENEIANLNKKAKSGRKFWIFGSKNKTVSDSESIKKEFNKFKVCNTNFNSCVSTLQEAIEETGKNLVGVNSLIKSLEKLHNEINLLSQSLEKNNDDVYLDSIITQKLNSITERIKILSSNAGIEKTKLVSALYYMNEQIPLFKERAEIVFAKMGEPLKTDVEANKTKPISLLKDELLNRIASLKTHMDKYNFIQTLFFNGNGKTVFTAEQAIEIMKNNNLFLDLTDTLIDMHTRDIFPQQQWRNWTLRFRNSPLPFLALYFAEMTAKSDDPEVNLKFYLTCSEMMSKSALKFHNYTHGDEEAMRYFKQSFNQRFSEAMTKFM